RRALGRDAPAGRVPAHAAGRALAAVPGRAVRGPRRAHPRAGAVVVGGGPGARIAHRGPRHPRRRGGGAARGPHRLDVAAPGPGGGRVRGRPAAPACAHRPGGRRAARACAYRTGGELVTAGRARRAATPLAVLAVVLVGWELIVRAEIVNHLL